MIKISILFEDQTVLYRQYIILSLKKLRLIKLPNVDQNIPCKNCKFYLRNSFILPFQQSFVVSLSQNFPNQ
ncbi:hypothetical protein pb186bvf_005194 [Paramecium bursaria]